MANFEAVEVNNNRRLESVYQKGAISMPGISTILAQNEARVAWIERNDLKVDVAGHQLDPEAYVRELEGMISRLAEGRTTAFHYGILNGEDYGYKKDYLGVEPLNGDEKNILFEYWLVKRGMQEGKITVYYDVHKRGSIFRGV